MNCHPDSDITLPVGLDGGEPGEVEDRGELSGGRELLDDVVVADEEGSVGGGGEGDGRDQFGVERVSHEHGAVAEEDRRAVAAVEHALLVIISAK